MNGYNYLSKGESKWEVSCKLCTNDLSRSTASLPSIVPRLSEVSWPPFVSSAGLLESWTVEASLDDDSNIDITSLIRIEYFQISGEYWHSITWGVLVYKSESVATAELSTLDLQIWAEKEKADLLVGLSVILNSCSVAICEDFKWSAIMIGIERLPTDNLPFHWEFWLHSNMDIITGGEYPSLFSYKKMATTM